MAVFRVAGDYYHFYMEDGDTLSEPWRAVWGNNGYANDHWTIATRPVPLSANVGYVDMSLSTAVPYLHTDTGLTVNDARGQDWLTLDNVGVSGASWVLNVVGVEYIDTPLAQVNDLEIIGPDGFTTNGSYHSITMRVGDQEMVYTGATRDSSLFMGPGYDTVNLGDHLDIPGTQYWSLVRRADGQIDAYSLFSGYRVRLEGGYKGWTEFASTIVNYGEIEKVNLAVYDTTSSPLSKPVYLPGVDLPNTDDRGNQTNIDLRSYEGAAGAAVNTLHSNSFNLAYFNFIRYTSDNVWVGQSTIHDANVALGTLGTNYSTPGDNTITAAKYGVTAPTLDVIGTSRNGTHDLIVAEQATAIDGYFRLYAFDVNSGMYNQFNQVYLGTAAGETSNKSTVTGNTPADRVALYGFGGNDVLKGGAGNDYLFGGQSVYNQLIGGATGNQVIGGAGADYFGVGNTNAAGALSGSNTTIGDWTQGYATDVIMDWQAGTDTLVVLSNGVAVIGGLYNVSGMAGNDTVDLRDYTATATSDQNGSGARSTTSPSGLTDATGTLLQIFNEQTSRDLQSIKNESDITVVNNGLIVLRGQEGNDTIYGSAGNDYLYGNRGDNVINLSEGGVDRVNYDTFFGKQYVTDFTSGSDKFYLSKKVIDSFGGSASRAYSSAGGVIDASNHTYDTSTDAVMYGQGLDYLHKIFYQMYLANTYGAQPYNTAEHASMDWSADLTTFGIGTAMMGVGYGLLAIPFVGWALGGPLIAAGALLDAGKIWEQVAPGSPLGTVNHENARLSSAVSFTGSYLYDLGYVYGSGNAPHTTAATGSDPAIDLKSFLDFFPNSTAGDGFTPVIELNPVGVNQSGGPIYAYFAVWSDSETFVYLVASDDNLIENNEAIKVAEISGHLVASDFYIYDSSVDIYNQVADAAIVLRTPTLDHVVTTTGSTPVPDDSTTSASRLTIKAHLSGTLADNATLELYDGLDLVTSTSVTPDTGGTTDSIVINDPRAVGQICPQTDANPTTGALYSLDLNNTFAYQDQEIAYYLSLTDPLTGIVRRSNVWNVTANGASNITVDGGAGTDTLMLEKTSGHLNNAKDEQIVNIENIMVTPNTTGLPTLSAVVTDGVITSVTIDAAGSGLTDGDYAVKFNDDTYKSDGTLLSAGGSGAAAMAHVTGGKITSVDVTAGGSGYNTATNPISVSGDFVGNAGVVIDLRLQTEGFLVTGLTAADTITGSAYLDSTHTGADTFVGGGGADSVNGYSGNDVFIYSTVADLADDALVAGGDGTDIIRIGAGSNAVTLDDGNFVHVTTMEQLDLSSNSGVQTVTLASSAQAAGIVSVSSGSGNDIISAAAYTTAAITISGADGNDNITGGALADSLAGGNGADTITGGAATDQMDGGSGDDVFVIAAGADHAAGETITGGSGTDTIRFTSTTAADTLTLRSTVTDSDNLIYVEISNVAGDNTGTTALNVNADALGADLDVCLTGNDGANTLKGNADANSTIVGGQGDDVIQVATSSELALDSIDGGEGGETAGDTIYFTTATTVVDADFSTSGTRAIAPASIENVRLTGASTLTLGAYATTAGIAKVYTGAGTTSITKTDSVALAVDATALANDTILTIDDSGVTTNFVVTGLTGNLSATNLAGTLTIGLGDASDNSISLALGTGNVTITGGSSTDTVTVTGQDVAQTIDMSASPANHTITTGSGVQTISVGTGVDLITTGSGDDIIVFGVNGSLRETMDTINSYAGDVLDFGNAVSIATSAGGVTVDSRGYATVAGATLADQMNTLEGAITAANQVVLFKFGDDTYVYHTGSGTGSADNQFVKIAGSSTLNNINVIGGDITLSRFVVLGDTTTVSQSYVPTTTAWSTGSTSTTPTIFTPGLQADSTISSNLIRDPNNLSSFGQTMGAGDDFSTLVDLTSLTGWSGVMLNMFGTNYTKLYMGSNGYVTFGTGFSGYSPSGLQTFTLAPMVAAQYDDLYIDNGARNVLDGAADGNSLNTHKMYFWYDATRLVFTWDNVGLYSNGVSDSYTTDGVGSAFQIIIHRANSADTSGDFGMEIRYEELSLQNSTATAGWTAGNTVNYGLINTSGSLVNNNAYQDAGDLATAGTNVGVAGVWGWEVKGGAVGTSFYLPDIGLTTVTKIADGTVTGVASVSGYTLSGEAANYFTATGTTSSPFTWELFTNANDAFNLWKDAFIDGVATVTVVPTGATSSSTININLFRNTNIAETVSRSGNQLTVSATSTYLNGASDSDIETVTSITAASAGQAVNITLSNQHETLTVTGSAYNDTLTGGAGNDSLTGGLGIDKFVVDSGTDTITDLGQGGADVLAISQGATASATIHTAWTATSDTVNMGTNTYANAVITTNGLAVDLSLASVTTAGTATQGYTVSNTGAATTITGSAAADSLTGGSGNDTITGGAGNDTITGGAGADVMDGGTGNNTFVFNTSDIATGETVTFSGTTDTFRVDSSENFYSLNASAVLTGLDVIALQDTNAFFNAQQLSGLTLSITDTAGGAVGKVTVYGDALANTIDMANITHDANSALYIDAGGGDDAVTGSAFVDEIFGNAGNDTITGGAGGDTLTGGGDADVFVYRSGDSYASGGHLDTVTDFASGTDKFKFFLTGSSVDVSTYSVQAASGGVGSTIGSSYFSQTDNAIYINAGFTDFATAQTYVVVIQDGVDVLATDLQFDIGGTGGNDILTGGAGSDTITGGAGNDTVSGGAGADTLVFAGTGAGNGVDSIVGFTVGTGGDVFNFKAFLPSGSFDQSASYPVVGNTGQVDMTNKVVELWSAAADSSSDVDTAGEIASQIGAGKAFVLTPGGRGIVISGEDTSANNTAYVWFVDATLDGDGNNVTATDVVLVGTLATFDVNTFTSANFAFT